MTTPLFIPAAEAGFAEIVYRLVDCGEVPVMDEMRTVEACRAMVSSFGQDVRDRLTIWRVGERFGPDGVMVVAEQVTDNVVSLRRRVAC